MSSCVLMAETGKQKVLAVSHIGNQQHPSPVSPPERAWPKCEHGQLCLLKTGTGHSRSYGKNFFMCCSQPKTSCNFVQTASWMPVMTCPLHDVLVSFRVVAKKMNRNTYTLRYRCHVGGKGSWCGSTKWTNHPGRENVDLNVQPKKMAALPKPSSISEVSSLEGGERGGEMGREVMVSEKEEEGKCAEELLGHEGEKERVKVTEEERVEVTEEAGDHESEGNAEEEEKGVWRQWRTVSGDADRDEEGGESEEEELNGREQIEHLIRTMADRLPDRGEQLKRNRREIFDRINGIKKVEGKSDQESRWQEEESKGGGEGEGEGELSGSQTDEERENSCQEEEGSERGEGEEEGELSSSQKDGEDEEQERSCQEEEEEEAERERQRGSEERCVDGDRGESVYEEDSCSEFPEISVRGSGNRTADSQPADATSLIAINKKRSIEDVETRTPIYKAPNLKKLCKCLYIFIEFN